MNRRGINKIIFATASGLTALSMLASLAIASSQIDIPGPPGSEEFGKEVTVLPNGNLVVCDPGYDAPGVADAGAAYLYDGESGALISTLNGSTAGDLTCFRSIVVLTNGNYLINSPGWDNDELVDVGAVTWANGVTGINGVISPENSLVGGSAGDRIGSDLWGGILPRALPDGNYAVYSPGWDNGPVVDAGAITFADGATGITGVVSAENSLVGSTSNDLASQYSCDSGETAGPNDQAMDAGAVTWNNGAIDFDSPIDPEAFDPGSHLVAGRSNDSLYAIVSPCWDNGPAVDAGAVTWVNTATGITGPISPANSLVGSTSGDLIGYGGVWNVGDGNYLVLSAGWDNGPVENAGAATWVNAKAPITGSVTPANSLVGSSANDRVGLHGSEWELANGNYLLISPY